MFRFKVSLEPLFSEFSSMNMYCLNQKRWKFSVPPASELMARAMVASEGSAGGWSACKPSPVVFCRPRLLTGCWPEGLGSEQAVPCHWAAHRTADDSPRASERVSRWGRENLRQKPDLGAKLHHFCHVLSPKMTHSIQLPFEERVLHKSCTVLSGGAGRAQRLCSKCCEAGLGPETFQCWSPGK